MDQEKPSRNFLLPNGCKDLLDVIRQDESQDVAPASPPPEMEVGYETTVQQIELHGEITVKALAERLEVPSYRIIAQLIQWHVFMANDQRVLDEALAIRVAQAFGCQVNPEE